MTRRRVIGFLALGLGALGSVIAVLSAVVIIWLGVTAGGIVEDTVGTITSAVDRLDTRLEETTAAVTDAEGARELRVRTQGIGDLAVNARESLGAIDDHPLFGRLPVDTSPVSSLLDQVEQSAQSVGDDLIDTIGDAPISTAVKTQITDRLTEAQGQLADINDRIDDVGNRLRLWIRIAALGGVLLCLWVLWAQVALAMSGWRARKRRPQTSPERALGE